MPTYDYDCQKCGETFEVFQSMNDPRLEDCLKDDCDGQLKRKIGTGAGVIFKGSGFYETDYRSDSYKKAAKKEAGGSEGSGGGKDPAAAEPKPKSKSKSESSSSSSSSSSGGSGSTGTGTSTSKGTGSGSTGSGGS